MRVERFSLFFPPLLARYKRGETEYAIGAIPLGGYVKITGMNPAEEIPPAVAHRAYYRQPVWKRIFVISAGPAVNIVLAFLILWVLVWANGVNEPRTRGRAASTAEPALACWRPATGSCRSTACAATSTTLRGQIASHKCAGEEADGCVAATPAMIVVSLRGEERTVELAPVYDASSGRHVRRLPGADATARRRPDRGRRLLGRPDVVLHHQDGGDDRRHLPGREAQGDLRRGRLLRGDAPVDRADDRARALPAGDHLPVARASSTCSRSCRSTAGTSSGRWPRRSAAARSRSA